MNSQITQTPIELIEYLKTIRRVAAPTYIMEEGNTDGYDWVLVGANEWEINKLSFSPKWWAGLTELWVVPGRAHLDLIDLTGHITEGLTEPRQKAEAIARWIFENVEYIINTEAEPWELVKPEVTGDCSSFTPLVCALLGICGIPCWGKQTAFWQEDIYSHMYTLALLPEGWFCIDPTTKTCFSREPSTISAYGLFEIDETPVTPPVVPPDQPTVLPPMPTWAEVVKMMPWLINVGLGLGLVAAITKK